MSTEPQSAEATQTQLPVSASDIDAAAERLKGVALCTPLQESRRLSDLTGATILMKREDLQPVRSYKIRGAQNLIAQLAPEERAAGVIAASAGNHAQGVALACASLGVDATIYVPSTTPRQKRERIMALGGNRVELVIGGETYDESSATAYEAAESSGKVLVPAFNDPRTIAGQGTLAREIFEQLGHAPDVVLVPVGGGGMVAGVLTWFAEHCPTTKIIGIEPEGAPCMLAAMTAGAPVALKTIDTFVDGAAVAKAGPLTFEIAAAHNLDLITVPEGRICSEMLDMYQIDGIIAEPAGALATAAIGQWMPEPGQTVVAIVSGGNNDVSRYAEIIERSAIYEGRKHYFLVSFPQEPGALRRFLDEVLGPNDDITYFEYVKKSNREMGPALVGIELGSRDDYPGLIDRLEHSNIKAEVIDPNSPMFRLLIT